MYSHAILKFKINFTEIINPSKYSFGKTYEFLNSKYQYLALKLYL